MFRILLFIPLMIMLSCGADHQPADDNDDITEKPKNMPEKNDEKFGAWEQDSEGTKFREDYELKEKLSGYEVVKYTRTDGGQYGGSNSTTKFTFCSDGTVRYYFQSLTTISVDGAGSSDGSKDEDEGTWRAIENENGVKILMMKSNKSGQTGYMEVKPQGGKIYMVWNGEWQEFLMKNVGC